MVLAAVVASFGVLIAGVTHAVQPLREGVRALQATMGDVRERLVRVEEGQARLEEDVARVLVLLGRAPAGWIVPHTVRGIRYDKGSSQEQVERSRRPPVNRRKIVALTAGID